jgi:hypothetical protein
MSKLITLKEFKIKYYSKYPDSTLEILEILPQNKAVVKNEFGKCIIQRSNILSNKNPTIQAAFDKNEYFINQAKKIHGDKYDYSLVKYVASFKKVKIICKEHGEFDQLSNNHLQGQGCNECWNEKSRQNAIKNPSGWSYSAWYKSAQKSRNFDSFKIYILKCWNENEEFYKIGKTFESVKNRFKTKCLLPYNWKIVQIFEFKELTEENCDNCCRLEKELQRNNKENKYLPKLKFYGMNECFKQIKN